MYEVIKDTPIGVQVVSCVIAIIVIVIIYKLSKSKK